MKYDRLFWLGMSFTLSMIWLIVIVEGQLYDVWICTLFGFVGLVVALGALAFEELQYRTERKRYKERMMRIEALGIDPEETDIDIIP